VININNKYYIDAYVSKDSVILDLNGKARNPDFREGIWYSGTHVRGNWYSGFGGEWLNGNWLDGVLWRNRTGGWGLILKISPKSYCRPKNTIALNYARYL